jgi:hypothetical protein
MIEFGAVPDNRVGDLSPSTIQVPGATFNQNASLRESTPIVSQMSPSSAAFDVGK